MGRMAYYGSGALHAFDTDRRGLAGVCRKEEITTMWAIGTTASRITSNKKT